MFLYLLQDSVGFTFCSLYHSQQGSSRLVPENSKFQFWTATIPHICMQLSAAFQHSQFKLDFAYHSLLFNRLNKLSLLVLSLQVMHSQYLTTIIAPSSFSMPPLCAKCGQYI